MAVPVADKPYDQADKRDPTPAATPATPPKSDQAKDEQSTTSRDDLPPTVNPTERREAETVRRDMLRDEERRPDTATLGTPGNTDSDEMDGRSIRAQQEEWPTTGWAPGTEPDDGELDDTPRERPLDKLLSQTGTGTENAARLRRT